MADRVFQFQEDFEGAEHGVLRASTTLRPDAVVLDALTAWSTGPIALGDASAGYAVRCWYARLEGNSIYVARSNAENNAWEAEALLYTYEGAVATEISLAFTRTGYAVIALERPTGISGASEVWLYWSDPLYA